MITKVVNVRKDNYDVYIGRQYNNQLFDYGNPYAETIYGSREVCLQMYKVYFNKRIKDDPEFRAAVLKLKGKKLGCHCKPKKACHGDIIVEYLSQFEVRI